MLFNKKHCNFFLTIDSLMFYSGFKNGRTANLFWEFARVSEERTGVLFLQVRSQHLKQFFFYVQNLENSFLLTVWRS